MFTHFFQKEYTFITFSNHLYRIVLWFLHYIISLICNLITMSWISSQLSAQTFSTSCSEFILPFLVSDQMSYLFVSACDIMYSCLQQICILATVSKNRAEYTNLLPVINTFSTSCSKFVFPFLVSDHVSCFVCFCMCCNVFLSTKKLYSCHSRQE
jgi:hypothetical protein